MAEPSPWGGEADLDVLSAGRLVARMPREGDAPRRLPDRDRSPYAFAAAADPLDDAAARAALHVTVSASRWLADGVGSQRPPGGYLRREAAEGLLGRHRDGHGLPNGWEGGGSGELFHGAFIVSLLEGFRIRVQRVGPHAVGVLAEVREARRVETIEAALGLGPAGDEARAAEHAEVLGDGRLRDAKVPGQLPDGVGPAAEPLDEAAPRRVGQGLDRLCISHNLYKYILIECPRTAAA